MISESLSSLSNKLAIMHKMYLNKIATIKCNNSRTCKKKFPSSSIDALQLYMLCSLKQKEVVEENYKHTKEECCFSTRYWNCLEITKVTLLYEESYELRTALVTDKLAIALFLIVIGRYISEEKCMLCISIKLVVQSKTI